MLDIMKNVDYFLVGLLSSSVLVTLPFRFQRAVFSSLLVLRHTFNLHVDTTAIIERAQHSLHYYPRFLRNQRTFSTADGIYIEISDNQTSVG